MKKHQLTLAGVAAHRRNRDKQGGRRTGRLLRAFAGPGAFALAFLLFGAPSSAGTSLIPTLAPAAHAYGGPGGPCYMAYAHQGSAAAGHCVSSTLGRINWHGARCSTYGGMGAAGSAMVLGGMATSFFFGAGVVVAKFGAAVTAFGHLASWVEGC